MDLKMELLDNLSFEIKKPLSRCRYCADPRLQREGGMDRERERERESRRGADTIFDKLVAGLPLLIFTNNSPLDQEE
jgi:hypothetical protein